MYFNQFLNYLVHQAEFNFGILIINGIDGLEKSQTYPIMGMFQLIQFKCKAYREEQLEHSHDWIGLTLLQSIDSIDNQYAEVKFSLMDQVIQKLIEINASGEDITGTYAS